MNITAQWTISRWIRWGFISVMITFISACTSSVQNTDNETLPTSTVNPDSLSPADSIKLAFDYTANGKKYQLTFLEFESVGCRECKKMEVVMDSVRDAYGDKVQVVFFHVRNNRKMTQHFGIDMIPVQVLLDKTGRECYRHIGYLPFNQLEQEIVKYGNL